MSTDRPRISNRPRPNNHPRIARPTLAIGCAVLTLVCLVAGASPVAASAAKAKARAPIAAPPPASTEKASTSATTPESTPESAGTSLESAAAKAGDTARTVAMSLIGLALAIASIVLAFRRDFKEAAGVFAVGIVAVLLATPAGLSLLQDTVTRLFGA
jgi:hypothetical protein